MTKLFLIPFVFLALVSAALLSNANEIKRKEGLEVDLFTSIWSQMLTSVVDNVVENFGEYNNPFSAFENYTDPYVFNRTLTFTWGFFLSWGETNAYDATIRGLSQGDVANYNYNRTSKQFSLKVTFPKLQFDGTYDFFYNDACLPPWGCNNEYDGDGEYYGIFENVTLEIVTDFTFEHRVRASDTWVLVTLDESSARLYAENYRKNGVYATDWEEFSSNWTQRFLSNFENNMWKGFLEESVVYPLNMFYIYRGDKDEAALLYELEVAGIPIVE